MKTKLSNLPLLTKLTIAGLVGCTFAIWTQWLSGDPAYTKFPPGPVFFIAVAAMVAFAARWWWTPLIGALIGLLVTSGWFVRLPQDMQRLTHPGSVGNFAPGIFTGSLLLITSLMLADVAGLAATVQNFRRMEHTADSSKVLLRLFGGLFVLMGIMVMASGVHVDKYHNLMHLTWGLLAVGASFLGSTFAKRFCLGSGVFYLALAILGLTIGDPSMNRMWHAGPMVLHTGDHIFHLVLGSVFVAISQMRVREPSYEQSHA